MSLCASAIRVPRCAGGLESAEPEAPTLIGEGGERANISAAAGSFDETFRGGMEPDLEKRLRYGWVR